MKKVYLYNSKLETTTIAEALKANKGSILSVKGILTSIGANGTYYLQDDKNAMVFTLVLMAH